MRGASQETGHPYLPSPLTRQVLLAPPGRGVADEHVDGVVLSGSVWGWAHSGGSDVRCRLGEQQAPLAKVLGMQPFHGEPHSWPGQA